MSEDGFPTPDAPGLTAARAWLRSATVGIAGLGLMGGSLGMALRGDERQAGRVLGWTRNPATGATALARGCVDDLAPTLFDLCQEADLLVLAVPVRSILTLLADVAGQVRPGTVLLDLGSTKGEIAQVMSILPATVAAVGGHPMCGKASGGPEAADADLYHGKVFVLSPTARTNGDAWARCWALAEAVGAVPLPIEARRHDRLVALISHLPYLAAAAIVSTAETGAAGDELVWRVAASGFRDTTRVAGSELDVMLDILLTNGGAVAAGLATLQAQIELLRELLARGDEVAVRAYLAQAQARRRGLFL